MKRMRGFTLIELMIVVAIVGILMMVAYPAYQEQIRKSRRSDGMMALGRLATLQEQYFFRENKYTDQFANLGAGVTNASPEGYYILSLVIGAGGETYTATATATGSQLADTQCKEYTVNNLGKKEAKSSTNLTTTGTCW